MQRSNESTVAETQRLELQYRLDAQKSQEARNQLGQFSTPPKLAREIVLAAMKLLPENQKLRFLEPGFGTGTFLSALRATTKQERIIAASGIELDPRYAEPSRDLWADTNTEVYEADFTEMEPPTAEAERFNLLVCNPPYSRHHHLSKQQKIRLQKTVHGVSASPLSGLAGLHCYFLLASHAWMQESGVAAWLIPSEFMEVNYGQQIREYLLSRVTLLRLHLFDASDVQFGDALVSSAVLFVRKEPPPPDHSVEFTFGNSVSRPSLSRLLSATELREQVRWPRPPFELSRQSDTDYTLSDFFSIKRGLATGDNSFFILTEKQIQQHNLPMRFFKPILPSPRHIQGDEIAGDSHGLPRIEPRLFLLDCSLEEKAIAEKYPELSSYLREGKKATVAQRYLCRHRKPWYSQEQRPPAPFLCPYMGRKRGDNKPFRFILNRSLATAPNVYLCLYPTGPLATALQKQTELAGQLWEILKTTAPETVFDHARTYGGGLHKWEPSELGRVPASQIADLLRLGPKQVAHQLPLFERRRGDSAVAG